MGSFALCRRISVRHQMPEAFFFTHKNLFDVKSFFIIISQLKSNNQVKNESVSHHDIGNRLLGGQRDDRGEGKRKTGSAEEDVSTAKKFVQRIHGRQVLWDGMVHVGIRCLLWKYDMCGNGIRNALCQTR